MSTIPNLSASMEEPPSTAGTVGIEKECVDPYTLQMIDQLFPGHHGIQFLAGILRQASVKQLALPELAVPEGTDVAVITVQSIRTLARLIGFSYDTTEKYIVVLSQLRLLHKKRYRRQIILHFPLCRCQVPDPEALESLDYRPKVTSFAGQVKRRIVLLRTSGNSHKVHFLKKATPSWQHRVNKVAFWMEKATLSLVEYLKKGDSESKKATPRVEQMVNKVHFLKKATPSWQHRVNKVAFWMEKATLSLVEYLKKGDSESKKATYL